MPTDHPLQELVDVLRQTEAHLARLADHFDPLPPDIVGTPYVAAKPGCTTAWIAMLVRDGGIPPSCLVPGTGNGKPWRFRRKRIDDWIDQR